MIKDIMMQSKILKLINMQCLVCKMKTATHESKKVKNIALLYKDCYNKERNWSADKEIFNFFHGKNEKT